MQLLYELNPVITTASRLPKTEKKAGPEVFQWPAGTYGRNACSSMTALWLTHKSLLTIDYCSPQHCCDSCLVRYNQDLYPPALLHKRHRTPVPYGSRDQVQRVKCLKMDNRYAFEHAK